MRPSKLRDVRAPDIGIRFAFGAAISVIAGLVSLASGPKVGGLLFAFPAILPATLTLIEKRESKGEAEKDDAGAVLGAVALIPFAGVTYALLDRTSGVVALGAATVAWLLVAVVLYAVVYGARDDESESEESPAS